MTDAPEAKPENMVTNVTMTIYGVESDAPEPKPEPRCAACGREKSSNRHDVRPDWYHAFVTEPASQPGESILCPQECLKFRMLGTCEHVELASQPGEFNNYDVRPFSPLPEQQAKHVEHWLKSNEKSPADVKWSLYPMGMVQRWIERALEAEVAAYRLGGKP